MTFEPADPSFESRVRDSFTRQRMMATLGATLERVEPGEIEIRLPYREELTQQHGFLHAGAVATIVDSACGYAAFSLMRPDTAVLSVEYKVNLMAPAKGERVEAIGRVLRPGRTITSCQGDAYAIDGDERRHVVTMLATVVCLEAREGRVD